jgi:hypothetical protein
LLDRAQSKLETDMSEKSLAQLEIGSPEWVAKRGAMSQPGTGGQRGSAGGRRAAQPDAMELGAIALAAGVVVLGLLRLFGMGGRR